MAHNGNGDSPIAKRRALLDRLWANALRSAPSQVDTVRSRLLVFLSLLSLCVNAVYAATLLGMGAWRESGVSLLTLGWLTIVFYHAWHHGWRRWTAHLYLYSAVLSLALFMLVHGAVLISVAVWWPFIPMLALILLERREGIAITVGGWLLLSAVAVHVTADPQLSWWAHWQAQWPLAFTLALVGASAVGVMQIYIYLRDLVLAQQQQERTAKEALIRILCHDIANNLSVIRMSVSSAMRTPTEVSEDLSYIRDASEGIIEVVNTVRSMAALEAGKLRIKKGPVDPVACMQQAMESLHTRILTKGLVLETSFPDVPVRVYGDAPFLTQTVLTNLISNAIKFTPRGGQIRLAVSPRDDQWVDLIVADKGVGIPAELIPRLFDPGQETHRVGTDGEPGTGFGLPLVKTFVEHFGGSIHVHTNSETQFITTLRRVPPQEMNQEATPTDKTHHQKEIPSCNH